MKRFSVIAALLVGVHAVDALVEKPGGRAAWVETGLVVAVVLGCALAARALLRGGDVRRGVVALVIGTGAVIEGAAVTAAHIVRDAPSGADFTGVLCFAAGLALAAVGVVVLTRRLHRWWRVLAIPAVAALLLYVVAPLVLAVIATHPPAKDVEARTPASEGLAYRDVSIATADGVTLAGWYIPSRNGAAVVTVPGAWGTRSDVLDESVVLARHGYGVLDLDPRGHGQSTGTANDFGWYGNADMAAAVDWLSAQPDVAPGRIGGLGLSMGGEELLTAAAADTRLQAVVSEGGTNRVFADVTPVASSEWLMIPAFWMSMAATDLLSPAASPIPLDDAVARIAPRPVLLIAASEEPELTLTRHLHHAAPQTTQVWEQVATAHTQGLATHPAEWTARVLGFLDAALSSTATASGGAHT
jgi:uncharacterized protein